MLAGIPSANALAERIGAKGLAGVTIRKIEAGTRDVQPHELREIARACRLPEVFFTIDFAVLETLGVEPELEDRLVERVTERVLARLRNDRPPGPERRAR